MMEKKPNYLDYIPRHNERFPYTEKENTRIEIKVVNQGFFHKMAQVFFRSPKYSYIELDEFGSFVWEQIDGKRSIYEICMLIKARFGEKAEPLYERAVTFFRILRKNAFIVYENKEGKRRTGKRE